MALNLHVSPSRSCGLDVHIISTQEAKEICPILRTDDVIVSQYAYFRSMLDLLVDIKLASFPDPVCSIPHCMLIVHELNTLAERGCV